MIAKLFEEKVAKYEEAVSILTTAPTLNDLFDKDTEVQIPTVASDETTNAASKMFQLSTHYSTMLTHRELFRNF